MNINYLLLENANLWYFVANLSNWSDYIRPALNKEIIEQTGNLSECENNTLNDLKALFVEYGYGQNYWGKDLLSGIEKNISIDSRFINISPSGIDELKKRFAKYWLKEKNKLEYWKNTLSTQNTINTGIVNDCNILFDQSDDNQEINVLLLISASGSVAGGADIGDKWVQLEVSGIGTQSSNHVTAVLWHEIIHLIWQKEPFNELIDITTSNSEHNSIYGYSLDEIIKETVAGSLLPYGLFRSKWLKDSDSESTLNKKINDFETRNIKNIYYLGLLSAKRASILSEEYINSNKKIDPDYINRLIKLIAVV